MECRTGEITGILGPNGAGKTTILKAICARHFATDGTVLVEEADAALETEKVRSMTGFVMEQSNLPGELKTSEFLKIVFETYGEFQKNHVEYEKRSEEIKRQFSLESVWNEKIKNLSKGFKERVNFAQALIYNPPVLVLDEPASGLDPAQIVNMRKIVLSLKKNHTIVLSTHLMQEVDALCDSVYILSRGKCVASGTGSKIAAENGCKNLEEAFFKLTN